MLDLKREIIRQKIEKLKNQKIKLKFIYKDRCYKAHKCIDRLVKESDQDFILTNVSCNVYA